MVCCIGPRKLMCKGSLGSCNIFLNSFHKNCFLWFFPYAQPTQILFYLPSKIESSTIPIVAIFLIMVWFKCVSHLHYIDNVCVLSFFVSTLNDLATFACTNSSSSSMKTSISNWMSSCLWVQIL